MGQGVWATIVSEFSDVSDLETITRITLRLLLAAVLGGVLGYERETKAKSAGVRTHMLVAVGAALFVIGPLQSGIPLEDMSRVLQGIGFLGAGAIIIRASQRKVEGLTDHRGQYLGHRRHWCRRRFGVGSDSSALDTDRLGDSGGDSIRRFRR